MSTDPTKLTAREAAEALWLAIHRAESDAETPRSPNDSTGQGDLEHPAREGGQPPDVLSDESADSLGDDSQANADLGTAPDKQAFDPVPPRSLAFKRLDIGSRHRLPRPAPLLDERAIGRALRPFNQRVASSTDLRLDEQRTAERAAEDDLWLPELTPAESRWFTAVLVVDDSPSMVVWRQTVAAFKTVLERQGAFRNVLVRRVNLDADEPVLVGEVDGSTVYSPGELIQPDRIVLVLTDGIGLAWRSGAAHRMLAEWSQRLPLAVVHLFPPRSWHITGLEPCTTKLRAKASGAANSLLEMPPEELYLDPPREGKLLPVPLLALNADSMGWWAQLVAGGTGAWIDAQIVFANPWKSPTVSDPARPAELRSPTALERIRSFQRTATPMAFELAVYLAATPLRLSMMHLVQHTMLPRSGPAQLAELLVSGLVRRVGSRSKRPSDDDTAFDFVEGVREQLLAAGARNDTAHVLRLSSAHLGDTEEVYRNLSDALLAPDTTPDPPVTPETADLVKVQMAALNAMSGPYLGRARRLSRLVQRASELPASEPDPTASSSAHQSMKDTAMSETDESIAAASQILTAETKTPIRGDSGVISVEAHPPMTPADRRPGDPPLVWGNVPPRNQNFTGRETLLEDLHQRLQAGTTAVLPEALHGMGGVGKSQIAVEYVYRHTADYDLIWWIPSDGPSQVASALVELAQQLGLARTDEAVIGVPAVRDALRSGRPYRNWLLVFDNAESPEIVRSFFPVGGPGHILVTSRNPQWANLARPLEVDVFEREESKELLHRRRQGLTDVDADRLSNALGDLPLAIEQAAAWLAETGMPAEEYLRLFEEKTSELLGAVETSDYQLSVAAAWNVSLDRLRTDHPAALQLLQVCSFFAPEPISRQLLSGVRDAPVPPELLTALRDPIRLGRAIREINRYALARIDHRNNTIQLHRLVQAVLIGQMSVAQRDEMRHAAHVLLASGDPNDPVPAAQWPRYRQLLPHVQASNAIDCEDPWVRNLVINTIQFLYQWGDHEAYRELAQLTVDIWQRTLGADNQQTLSATQWLGRSLRLLGHYDRARALNETGLELMRQSLGEEHEDTNLMMNSVAADLRIQGDFQAARGLNRQAAEIAERVFGEDDPSTLIARHNLAVSTRLCGDFKTALELDLETQDREIQVLGEQNRLTLNTLNALGLDELESGLYLAARTRQESTVMRHRRALGDDNPQTVLAIQTLAVARRRAGDHEGAYEMSQEALDRFRQRYGKDDPASVSAAANLAVDLRQTGDLQGSKNLGERTLDRYRNTFGENHPHTLAAAINHAVVVRLLGNARAAHQIDDSALVQLRERLGVDHPLTLTCATNLASDLAALGEVQAAHDLGSETFASFARVLTADHPSTLVAGANLALDLGGLTRAEESTTLHESTIERLRHVLGYGHPAARQAASHIRLDCDANPLPL